MKTVYFRIQSLEVLVNALLLWVHSVVVVGTRHNPQKTSCPVFLLNFPMFEEEAKFNVLLPCSVGKHAKFGTLCEWN